MLTARAAGGFHLRQASAYDYYGATRRRDKSAGQTVLSGEPHLHHFRVPREREELDKNRKTSADEDLDETEDGNEPVEARK